MLKHYIHCHQGYDLKKGGSVGYISSLFSAFLQNNPSRLTQMGTECCFLFPNILPHERISNDLLSDIIERRFCYTQQYFKDMVSSHLLKKRQEWFREIIPFSEYAKIDSKNIASIHIHGAYNFLPVYNSLIRLGVESRVVKILTTHNPYQPTMEDMYLTCRNTKWTEADKEMFRYYFNERDKWAFKLADCLFFPTEESLEGYYKLWPDFPLLIKDKPIYFCPTGTDINKPVFDKKILRESLDIPNDAKVFLYLGRFIDVRGYDILINAAKKIISKNDRIYFVVVGEKQTVQIQSKQWIQIPFTDKPQEYVNMADACLCPNRGSLFDLSMIEFLAFGKPIICSYVGGYRWLENKTSGMLYSSVEDIDKFADNILLFSQFSNEKVNKMQDDNIKLYKKCLSLNSFQENYCGTIDNIYRDFGISEKIYNISYCDKTAVFLTNVDSKREFLIKEEPKVKSLEIVKKADSKQEVFYRKFKKLIKNPYLFFKDFLRKRL
ncbi:glycosyltransferase, family 4 [Campylobacter lari]|uniref:glycosyltransferase family 4 protein n=1 Tax=Campylobacter lari TaxID=201 RepID=UPI0021533003|nr:glycosyltransferase family 4 protein [Campylobacter lari]MCR6517936.1 glycosyltransferase family 4 protein [Campylobacter lari]